tara:strand:- start:206 stop:418 length:213 start_codon:yes stop_codon:yes gene_type:complete
MSKQLYDVYLINALIRKENAIQQQIIHKLKAQRRSKSQTHGNYYEKDIVRLTKQLDDLYVVLGKTETDDQ